MNPDTMAERQKLPESVDPEETERYTFLRHMALGGFGATYLAEDRIEQRSVVVKTIPNNLGTPRWLNREFEILSHLSHPNVVQAYEKFVREGTLCFAMEHIDGVRLMLAIGAPCGSSLSSVGLHAFGQLQNALDYLHQQGVMHGGLVPRNILVDRDGVLKLTDFELCQVQAAWARDLQMEDSFVGVPNYMSPEHPQGTLRPESDYFVVGTLLGGIADGAQSVRGWECS
jgi:serine/threonine protein kinase